MLDDASCSPRKQAEVSKSNTILPPSLPLPSSRASSPPVHSPGLAARLHSLLPSVETTSPPATSFPMSFNLQESVLLLQAQDETIPIQNELDVPSMSESEAMDYLERESILQALIFDRVHGGRGHGGEEGGREGRRGGRSNSCCCFSSTAAGQARRLFQRSSTLQA